MVEEGFFCLPPSVLKAQFTAGCSCEGGKGVSQLQTSSDNLFTHSETLTVFKQRSVRTLHKKFFIFFNYRHYLFLDHRLHVGTGSNDRKTKILCFGLYEMCIIEGIINFS